MYIENTLTEEERKNLQLLLGVPLQISVEIGTVRRTVKDILAYKQGMLVKLDCHANAPVDVVANRNLIARGEVVVIDDCFAVRITEIIKSGFENYL